MKITIENTSRIVHLDNVTARIWEGKTDSGIPVICYITGIGAANAEHEKFRHEFLEQRPPSPAAEAVPGKLIL